MADETATVVTEQPHAAKEIPPDGHTVEITGWQEKLDPSGTHITFNIHSTFGKQNSLGIEGGNYAVFRR